MPASETTAERAQRNGNGAKPQRIEALERANAVRFARADVKRRVTAGEVHVMHAVLDPAVATMTIYDLLRSQRGWGHKKTAWLLSQSGLSESRPCGALTRRQRQLLRHELGRRP